MKHVITVPRKHAWSLREALMRRWPGVDFQFVGNPHPDAEAATCDIVAPDPPPKAIIAAQMYLEGRIEAGPEAQHGTIDQDYIAHCWGWSQLLACLGGLRLHKEAHALIDARDNNLPLQEPVAAAVGALHKMREQAVPDRLRVIQWTLLDLEQLIQ